MEDVNIRTAITQLRQGKTLQVPLLCEILLGLAEVAEQAESGLETLNSELSTLQTKVRSLEDERQQE